MLLIDIRISIEPSRWSYVYKEDFFNALSTTLGVQFTAIELLNDARSENSFVTKLHFQIRILRKDHDDGNLLTDYAESLTDIIWSADFTRNLVKALEENSVIKSSLDHSRYSWLNPSDIQVLNAAVRNSLFYFTLFFYFYLILYFFIYFNLGFTSWKIRLC
jgi:hypothetical protein